MSCMEISITVTKNCNLKCKYCYQGIHDSTEELSLNTISEIVELVKNKMRAYNDSALYVVFIGGEPLLAYKKIKDVINTFEGALSNIRIRYYITTNGTIINDDIIALLKKNRVEVSISIDGNQKTHDKNRIDKKNNGTYKKVLLNMQRLCEEGILITGRMTISPETAQSFYEDVISLYEAGIKTINPVCDFACTWESTQLEDLRKSYRLLAQWYIEHYDQVTLACFEGRFYSLLTRKQKFCNAGTGLHYTISTSGDVYPCNYVTDNERFKIGDCNKPKTSSDVYNLYLQYISTDDEKCKLCEASDFCYGRKCCFLNWKTTGFLNIVSPVLCEHEKFMFRIVQHVLLAISEKESDILQMVRYIKENDLGNKTYKRLEKKLWKMI
ncbi:MAG TPA: radical SAM protein [Candidatus Fimimorpha faecalis]|uniref:Radical SAM protein n=1 Tax=Candidatus Fimimorpha faecalis TaxID=2840824 RepID=A0A9D1EEB0_9FIRM|nr:radical SAM protein [Candidatus Fimimorpha faecalis]